MRIRIPVKASAQERQMAAPLLLVILAVSHVSFVVAFVRSNPGAWPLLIPVVGGAALLFIIVRGVSRDRAYKGLKVTTRTVAYAFAWAAAIETFYGTFILVTGRLPTKLNSHAVPRSDSIMNFALALIWCVLAFVLTRLSNKRQP